MPCLLHGWRWIVRSALAVAAGAVPACPAPAATIAVVPIRIELNSAASFCSLHVSNHGQDRVAIQVRGFAWSQLPDGTDRLDPADIRVNPSIMELGPGQRRLVRCSLPPHPGATESAYRLLLDEVPRANPALGTMQTVLRLSVPIFRKPTGAAPQLQWKAAGAGTLELSNAGGMHAVVGKLIVSRAGLGPETIERGFYLLAGARRTIALAGDTARVTKVEAVAGSGQAAVVAKVED